MDFVLVQRHAELGLVGFGCCLLGSFVEFLWELKFNSSKPNKDVLSAVISSEEAGAAGPGQRLPEAALAPAFPNLRPPELSAQPAPNT